MCTVIHISPLMYAQLIVIHRMKHIKTRLSDAFWNKDNTTKTLITLLMAYKHWKYSWKQVTTIWWLLNSSTKFLFISKFFRHIIRIVEFVFVWISITQYRKFDISQVAQFLTNSYTQVTAVYASLGWFTNTSSQNELALI